LTVTLMLTVGLIIALCFTRLGITLGQEDEGPKYLHIEKPCCGEQGCSYDRNLRVSRTLSEQKKEISDSLQILARLGMAEGIDGHISVLTAPPPGRDENKTYLLMDRFGVGWHIMTPQDIITIESGTKRIYESNWEKIEWRAAIWMNEAIHEIRPDVKVVLHLHSPYSRILGATDGQFEMIDQNSLRFFQKIGYHDYEGVVVDPAKSESLAQKIKDFDVLILRNHGVIILGPSVPVVWNRAYFLENAAKAQIDAYQYAAAAKVNVVKIDPEVVAKNWKKFQGQAEELFAYYNFESFRRFYGLTSETDGPFFFENDS